MYKWFKRISLTLIQIQEIDQQVERFSRSWSDVIIIIIMTSTWIQLFGGFFGEKFQE